MANDFIDTTRAILEWQSLKFSAGRAITCPGCGKILDAHNAVEITLSSQGKPVHVSCLCGSCFDTRAAGNLRDAAAAVEKHLGHRVSIGIIDGREFDDDGMPLEQIELGPIVEFKAAERRPRRRPALVDHKGPSIALRPSWLHELEDPIACACYRNDHDRRAYCVELSSGYAIAHGETPAQAARLARSRLETVGRDVALNAFQTARKSTIRK